MSHKTFSSQPRDIKTIPRGRIGTKNSQENHESRWIVRQWLMHHLNVSMSERTNVKCSNTVSLNTGWSTNSWSSHRSTILVVLGRHVKTMPLWIHNPLRVMQYLLTSYWKVSKLLWIPQCILVSEQQWNTCASLFLATFWGGGTGRVTLFSTKPKASKVQWDR